MVTSSFLFYEKEPWLKNSSWVLSQMPWY